MGMCVFGGIYMVVRLKIDSVRSQGYSRRKLD